MALLKFKRSAVPAKVPAINDLDLGELAINTYDGKVYTKKNDGTPAIVEVGGGGSGVQTVASADGSVTVTGTTNIDLSVAVAAATANLILPVRNNTGATLAKGTAVYINGALGQNPTVTKAIATGDATSAQTLGLVTANIANNTVGNVTLIGSLTNIDTSAYSDGAQLYLSPTTAGALTATKPYAPSHLVYMAVVEHAHPSQGKLFVKVQNGYEMDELHNVSAVNPANNDGLFYNTSTNLWEKKSIVTALGYTPANKAGDTFTGIVNFGGGTFINGNGDIHARRDNGTTGVYYFVDGGTKYLYWDGGQYFFGGAGSVASPVDFRAPIFYDSNDTAYYLDAASTGTALSTNGILIAGTGTAGGVQNRTYTAGRNRIWSFANADTYGISYFQGGPDYIGLHPSGTATQAGSDFWVSSSGIAQASGSFRAPIFYDSNNTGYYIDAASNSVLNTLTLGGRATDFAVYYSGFTLDANTMPSNSTGFTYAVNAPFVGPVTRLGHGAYDLWFNAPYGGGGRLAFRTRNGDTASINAWQYPALYDQNVNGGGALYATLYYDQSDTAYYVDPAASSSLSSLLIGYNGSTLPYNDASTGKLYFGSLGSDASTYYHITTNMENVGGNYSKLDFKWYTGQRFYTHYAYGGVRFKEITTGNTLFSVGEGDLNVRVANALYSPIYYDGNNSAYYVDPASGTVLNRLVSITGAGNTDGGNLQLGDKAEGTNKWSVMTGAHFNGVSQAKGVMLIGSYSNSTANQVSIGGNVYEANPATQIVFFTSPTATHATGGLSRLSIDGNGAVTASVDIRAPIFYDSNNTGYYLDPNSGGLALRTSGYWIADSTAWAGDINGKIQYHDNSWYISAGNQWVFRASSGAEPFRVTQGGIAIATADMRAPIFYDNNNTGFYGDFASTSRLERLVLSARYDNYFVGSMAVVNAVNNFQTLTDTFGQMNVMQVSDTSGFTNAPTGLYPYGAVMSWRTENHSYQMYASHTGDLAYKTQWNNDNYSGWQTPVIYGRIGNSASGRGIYGSVYYDTDNTGFFLNPTGTSTLANLDVASVIDSAAYYDAAIEIRERSFGGALTTSLSNAPRLGFHWGGRVAMQLVLDSGGTFNVMNGDTSGYSGMASGNFTANGSITATGNVTAYSDIRIKANVETIPDALDKLDQIRGVTYTRTDLDDKEQRYAGVIAQEIEAVLPEAVRDMGNVKAVDYNATIGLLIQAVKELRDEVETLKRRS